MKFGQKMIEHLSNMNAHFKQCGLDLFTSTL